MATRTKPADARVAERLVRRNQGRTDWRDGAALRGIEEARHASETAECALVDAVHAARDDGYSWTAIGFALGGISKQAAHQRFAD